MAELSPLELVALIAGLAVLAGMTFTWWKGRPR